MKMIIDGGYLVYRTKSIKGLRNLSSNGIKTGIVYGVLNTLRKLIKQGYRDLEIAYDKGYAKHRKSLYERYKGNRSKSGCKIQSSEYRLLEKALYLFDIPQFWHPELEADDVIATRAKEENRLLIYTVDTDLYQLIDDNVKIYHPKNGLIGEQEVINEYNVEPKNLLELFSITGDKSDNIPGIKGIGNVIASKYIKGKKLTKRQKKLIEENKDIIERNKKLIRLKTDCKLRNINNEMESKISFLKFLEKYEMESLKDIIALKGGGLADVK